MPLKNLLLKHPYRLAMRLPMQQRHNQTLRQAGSLGRVNGFGNGAIQIGQGLVDVLAHG